MKKSCEAPNFNYEAEAMVIDESHHHISNIFTQMVNRGTLETLGNEDLKDMTIRKMARNISNAITAHTINITLQ